MAWIILVLLSKIPGAFDNRLSGKSTNDWADLAFHDGI
jgi:hypothetical protein